MIAAPAQASPLSATLASCAFAAAVLLTPAPAGGWGSYHGPLTTDHVVSSRWGTAHGPQPTAHASRSWADHLREHLARYPLAQAEDVYKFTHQAVYGPAHAVPSRHEARRYLEEEMAALPAGPAQEPLLDTLSEQPPLARVNLRPFLAAGGDTQALLDAFIATASRIRGDPAIMAARLDAAIVLLRELRRTDEAGRLSVLARERAAADYPATHHGGAYRDAYHPAYRVVDADLLYPARAAPAAEAGHF